MAEKHKQTIVYKRKKYPIRVITMKSSETGVVTNTIADESLEKQILRGDKYLKEGMEEFFVDQRIYFYVKTGQLKLSAKEICEKCLDMKFKFISEK